MGIVWVGLRLILGGLVALGTWMLCQSVTAMESGQPAAVAPDGPERLEVIVQTLAETIGPRSYRDTASLAAAADFITQSFQAGGYTVMFQPYDVKGQMYRNIIAERRGTEEPDRVLIVGAHYDTVEGTPGVDDNASGVAVLLELARLHAATRFLKTVRFVAFTLEEPPFFRSRKMGSRVYARSLKERGEQVEGMLCLEMVGYYSQEKGS